MSIAVTFNGSTYNIPQYNDTGWAQNSGNLSLFLVAVAQSFGGWTTDIILTNPGSGVIIADAYNGHTYRILMANGIVSTQLIT